MLYSVKYCVLVSESRNSDAVKENIFLYDSNYGSLICLYHLVLLEECGFNKWTYRTQGRFPIGK